VTQPGGAWRLDEALVWLESHVNFEAIQMGRRNAPTLERMAQLASLMGDPQHAYPVVHLTGTNGKGSTARMVTSLLLAMGLHVGTYTSPNVESINERLAWDDRPVADEELAALLQAVAQLEPLMSERPLRFEILTAAAFRWFADVAVDAAVLEVGLGGRWDATNVADGQVAVVTNVSLDHVEVLGPTVADIASEKAGIVKPGSTLVLGETDPVLAEIFERAGPEATWRRGRDFGCVTNEMAHGGRLLELRTPQATYPDIYLPLHGAHQGENAACALAAAEAFFGSALERSVVEEGFAAATSPGRMEVVGHRPLRLLDGAHNPAGAEALGATVAEEFASSGTVVLVIGLLRGRDPVEMLSRIVPERVRRVIACPPPSPRALPPEELVEAAASIGLDAEAAGSPTEAVVLADDIAAEDETILVTGSMYVVGEARTAWAEGSPRRLAPGWAAR
jgi:dihydrofolate synthase/folylpolyglutamate synthase